MVGNALTRDKKLSIISSGLNMNTECRKQIASVIAQGTITAEYRKVIDIVSKCSKSIAKSSFHSGLPQITIDIVTYQWFNYSMRILYMPIEYRK